MGHRILDLHSCTWRDAASHNSRGAEYWLRNPQIKPDGLHRRKVADIIRRFEERGFKLVGIKAHVRNQ